MNSLYPEKILAFDLETSGLSSKYDDVLQIGAIVMECGVPVGEPFSVRIKPDAERMKVSLQVVGLTMGRIDEGSLIEFFKTWERGVEYLPALTAFCAWAEAVGAGSLPVIAWNASFDYSFYMDRLMRFTTVMKRPPLSPVWICPMTMFKRLDSTHRSYSLESVAGRYGVVRPAVHDALEDAKLAGFLYDVARTGILEGNDAT